MEVERVQSKGGLAHAEGEQNPGACSLYLEQLWRNLAWETLFLKGKADGDTSNFTKAYIDFIHPGE